MDDHEQADANRRKGWLAGLRILRILLGIGAMVLVFEMVSQTESRWGAPVL